MVDLCPWIRRRALRSVLVGGALVLGAGPVASGTGDDPSRSYRGATRSYWGPIPAPADSVRAVFTSPSPSMAATVADAPYAVVSFPLRLFSRGVRGGFLYLDESGVIYTLSQLLAPRELPWGFAFSATAGGLTGWGGGVTFVHDRFLGEANRFRLGAKTSETGHHKAHLGLYLPHGLHEVEVGVGYRANPNARYFGIGFGSRPEDRSYFKQELTWGGLSYERHLGWDTFLKPEVLYTQVHALPSPRDEDSPNLETHFSGAIPVGFQDRSDGVTWSISLGRDTTRETGRPVGGGVERVKVDYYHDVDEGDHRHWTYRVEVQRFVPLGFHDLRVLALRAYYTRIEAVGDDPVPFQRLMTNDDPDLLRGFRDYRFRDEGMVAFTAEYRWPVWADRHARHAGVDAYLFTDLGQVFSEPDDIALDHLSESYGVGARLVLPSGFVGRLEWGHSIEDDVVRLRVDQVFQFQRSSLFHGRNPIPTR